MINGSQVDFQAAIVYDPTTGAQTGYQHLYIVRQNPVGDDLNDQFSDTTPDNPCLDNPCKNNATCAVGFGNNYACFCPPEYTG